MAWCFVLSASAHSLDGDLSATERCDACDGVGVATMIRSPWCHQPPAISDGPVSYFVHLKEKCANGAVTPMRAFCFAWLPRTRYGHWEIARHGMFCEYFRFWFSSEGCWEIAKFILCRLSALRMQYSVRGDNLSSVFFLLGSWWWI